MNEFSSNSFIKKAEFSGKNFFGGELHFFGRFPGKAVPFPALKPSYNFLL
jgi:hypothetical protein